MFLNGLKLETFRPHELDAAEMGALVELVREPFLWFAPHSTDSDIVARLSEGETAQVDVVYREGRPCGFGTYHHIVYNGAVVMYRGGTVILPSERSRGIYRELVRLCLERTQPKFLVTRTQNPRVYETFAHFAQNGVLYPNPQDVPPNEVGAIAQALNRQPIDPRSLIVRDVYGDLRDDRSFMTARSEGIQRFFSAQLGRNDAFMVVAPVAS